MCTASLASPNLKSGVLNDQDLGFCGICGVEVPLLSQAQVAEIERTCSSAVEKVRAYRAAHGGPDAEVPQAELFAPVYEKHLDLTGVDLRGIATSAHHILVHQKSCLGPPCWSCGKLLRSQYDRHCSACGAEKNLG